MLEFLYAFDVQLMYFFNVAVHNPVFDQIMPLFHHGNPWRIPFLLIALAVLIFGGKRGRWALLGAIVMVGLTDPLSSHVIKPLVGRIRPCNVLPHLWLFKGHAWLITPDPVVMVYKSSFSFPSSHAANMGGQMLWWAWVYPKMRWVLYSLAVIIGYSRIYDGVHYPIDVFVGFVLAGGCFMGLYAATMKWGPQILRERKPMALS